MASLHAGPRPDVSLKGSPAPAPVDPPGRGAAGPSPRTGRAASRRRTAARRVPGASLFLIRGTMTEKEPGQIPKRNKWPHSASGFRTGRETGIKGSDSISFGNTVSRRTREGAERFPAPRQVFRIPGNSRKSCFFRRNVQLRVERPGAAEMPGSAAPWPPQFAPGPSGRFSVRQGERAKTDEIYEKQWVGHALGLSVADSLQRDDRRLQPDQEPITRKTRDCRRIMNGAHPRSHS